jgi:hypothetical protein
MTPQMAHVLLADALRLLVDKTPKPADVKAGWVAFFVFIALGVAVVLLGMSLSRQLRKTRSNAEHGVFDDDDSGDR